MSLYCFWILLDGRIIAPDSKHIIAVVNFPEIFGETAKSINATFSEYGEQSPSSNHEGRARESILLRIIQKNNVRIRKHQLKRNQHWSIQLYELTQERKQSISKWARYISSSDSDAYAAVIMDQFKDGQKIYTSLDILAGGWSDDGVEEIVIWTESQLSELYKK
ncbi:MAG: hypothetical protein KJ630_14670 [Proteobacteria bacterium]|nr:hypothetical protein [Pseudomonadota bacterium]